MRLISEGRWNVKAERIDDEGFTIWGVKQDGSRRATQVDDLDEVVAHVLKP